MDKVDRYKLKRGATMIKKQKLKRIAKYYYFRLLCQLLNPNNNLNLNDEYPVKKWLTGRVPGNRRTALFLVISGKVTGVGFRSWIERNARLNGLEFWVRNQGVGKVEALLIGNLEGLETICRKAWTGPKRAVVTNIKEQWFNQTGLLTLSHNVKEEASQPGDWSAGTASLIRNALDYLQKKSYPLNELNQYSEDGLYKGIGISNEDGVFNNSIEIKNAALKRNMFFSTYAKNLYIVTPKNRIGFANMQSTLISSILDMIASNKLITKRIMLMYGFQVPEGTIFTDYQEALDYLVSFDYPLVVKPLDSKQGKGVTVDITSKKDLKSAWYLAKKESQQIILEKLKVGIDVRIWIVGGKAITALFRVPAYVIGDGKKTLRALIDRKNKQKLKNPHQMKKLIIADITTHSFINRQGYSMDSVPKKGDIVFVHLKANVAAGGDSFVITELIHPDLLRMAEEMANALKMDEFCALDLIVERLDAPRHKQECSLIEANTRANIVMTRFPSFGKPADTAQVLVDHLFPEKTIDDAYPIDTIRVEITGVLGRLFFAQVVELGKEYNLCGFVRPVGFHAEAFIKGYKHKVLFFLERVFNWKQGDQLVDGLRVFPYNGPLTNRFILEEMAEEIELRRISLHSGFNPEKMTINQYDHLEYHTDVENGLNIKLFIEELERRGYQARHLYEDLIEIYNESVLGITGMRFSSLFCDRMCDKIHPIKKILAFNGLPVPRGIMFKSKKKKNALDYFNHLSLPCVVTIMHPIGFIISEVCSTEKLKRIAKKVREKGVNKILLEEKITGFKVSVAVVGDQVGGSLTYEPIRVQGDGISSIAQLVEKKNRNRKKNPWYLDKPLIIDKIMLKSIKKAGYQIDDVPPLGKIINLESETLLELGGEAIGIDELLHEDFKKKAVQAVSSIPGLEYAVVDMVIPCLDAPETEQNWAITKVHTSPDAARFHFPWKGKPSNLVRLVVDKLCLTDRTKWIDKNVEYKK